MAPRATVDSCREALSGNRRADEQIRQETALGIQYPCGLYRGSVWTCSRIYRNWEHLSDSMLLVLAKRGCFKKKPKLPAEMVGNFMVDIRKADSPGEKAQMRHGETPNSPPQPRASPVTRVDGENVIDPTDLS